MTDDELLKHRVRQAARVARMQSGFESAIAGLHLKKFKGLFGRDASNKYLPNECAGSQASERRRRQAAKIASRLAV